MFSQIKRIWHSNFPMNFLKRIMVQKIIKKNPSAIHLSSHISLPFLPGCLFSPCASNRVEVPTKLTHRTTVHSYNTVRTVCIPCSNLRDPYGRPWVGFRNRDRLGIAVGASVHRDAVPSEWNPYPELSLWRSTSSRVRASYILHRFIEIAFCGKNALAKYGCVKLWKHMTFSIAFIQF